MFRILSNLAEHIRTLRGLTATRLRLDPIDRKIHDLRDDVGALRDDIRASRDEIHASRDEIRTSRDDIRTTREDLRASREDIRLSRDDVRILGDELRGLGDRVARLFTEWRSLRRHMDQNNNEMESYRARITGYREEMSDLASMIDLQRRSYVGITRQLASVGKEHASPVPRLETADPFVSVFRQEVLDRFRGSPDEVRHRLGVYLPQLDFLDQRKKPKIVDLGSGRGEWLDLVCEAGHPITAVFADQASAPEPPPESADMAIADPLAWLADQADRSIDVVTAFQVIERLQFDRLVATLKEVMRVLKPGGKVILETPNPENILVGAHTFWLDPDRVRPLPPVLMEQLMRSLAFTSIDVLRLPPHDTLMQYRNPEALPDQLNELLAGSDNYAIIAEKS